MSESDAPPPFWVRVVADERFRAALIDDPLRALATAGPIEVSAEQVRQLEDLTVDERREMVTAFVREVHTRGAQARFGRIGEDGRLGGPDNPEVR
ncbi:MAG: hypothetical protein U0Y82_05305 [Thermoleophilia bacterium]